MKREGDHPDAVGAAHVAFGAALRELRLQPPARSLRAMRGVASPGYISEIENGIVYPSAEIIQKWIDFCVPAGDERTAVQARINKLSHAASVEHDNDRGSRAQARPAPQRGRRAAAEASRDADTSAVDPDPETGPNNATLIVSMGCFGMRPLHIEHLMITRTYRYEHRSWWAISTRYDMRIARTSVPIPEISLVQRYQPFGHNHLDVYAGECDVVVQGGLEELAGLPGLERVRPEDVLQSHVIDFWETSQIDEESSSHDCAVEFRHRQRQPYPVAETEFMVLDPAPRVDYLTAIAQVVDVTDYDSPEAEEDPEPRIIRRKTYDTITPDVLVRFRAKLPKV